MKVSQPFVFNETPLFEIEAGEGHGILAVRLHTGAGPVWSPVGESNHSIPVSGAVIEARPVAEWVYNESPRALFLPSVVTARTNSEGEAGLRLLATDNAAGDLSGFRWEITVKYLGQKHVIGNVQIYEGRTVSLWEAAVESGYGQTQEDRNRAMNLSFKGAFNEGDGRLVTNGWAYQYPNDPRAHVDPWWLVTSGSVFIKGDSAWSGVPDHVGGGPDSALGTNSKVFRMVSRYMEYRDNTFRFRVDPIQIGTVEEGAKFFDGMHVMMRYNPYRSWGYFFTFLRQDNQAVIKRKYYGAYETLAQIDFPAASIRRWTEIETACHDVVVDGRDGCNVSLKVDGEVVLEAFDPNPLNSTGGIGVRGDNTEFQLRDFYISD